jgi:hypothetical protein
VAQCLEVVRRRVEGQATNEELAVAFDVAFDAAADAARAARAARAAADAAWAARAARAAADAEHSAQIQILSEMLLATGAKRKGE